METVPPQATLLIIEDDPLMRQSLAVFLENGGFHILQAGNGRASLEIFQQQNPDLLILDLQLPGMSGIEFLAAIINDLPVVPIIVVSGTGTRDDIVATLKLGVWDYLAKPIVDPAVLEQAVISTHQGRLYDAAVVDSCLALFADGRFSFEEGGKDG